MPALAYEDVHKSFGDHPALRGITLEVHEGEILGLLGPNGAGKTTLIRCGLDIIRPDAGEVTLFGAPLDRRGLDRVTYLPEERGLYKNTKVVEVLAYFGRLKGLSLRDARALSARWLDKVGLGAAKDQQVGTLSKGMGQKAQIASALMTEPDLCILDEPFSGLDPVNLDLVRSLIRERRAAGKATILSTHVMSQVEMICDRVALVNAGELVVYGTVEQVRREYSAPEARVRVDGELPEVAGLERVGDDGDGLVRLRFTNGLAPADALAQMVAAGARVEHFEPVLATMEQIFLRVVRARDAEHAS